MEGRGRPSYYNIGDVPDEPGMIRRNSRSDAAPPYQRPRASSVPRGAAFSPVSNLSALERYASDRKPSGSLLYLVFQTALCYSVVSVCFVDSVSSSPPLRPEPAPKRDL